MEVKAPHADQVYQGGNIKLDINGRHVELRIISTSKDYNLSRWRVHSAQHLAYEIAVKWNPSTLRLTHKHLERFGLLLLSASHGLTPTQRLELQEELENLGDLRLDFDGKAFPFLAGASVADEIISQENLSEEEIVATLLRSTHVTIGPQAIQRTDFSAPMSGLTSNGVAPSIQIDPLRGLYERRYNGRRQKSVRSSFFEIQMTKGAKMAFLLMREKIPPKIIKKVLSEDKKDLNDLIKNYIKIQDREHVKKIIKKIISNPVKLQDRKSLNQMIDIASKMMDILDMGYTKTKANSPQDSYLITIASNLLLSYPEISKGYRKYPLIEASDVYQLLRIASTAPRKHARKLTSILQLLLLDYGLTEDIYIEALNLLFANGNALKYDIFCPSSLLILTAEKLARDLHKFSHDFKEIELFDIRKIQGALQHSS